MSARTISLFESPNNTSQKKMSTMIPKYIGSYFVSNTLFGTYYRIKLDNIQTKICIA